MRTPPKPTVEKHRFTLQVNLGPVIILGLFLLAVLSSIGSVIWIASEEPAAMVAAEHGGDPCNYHLGDTTRQTLACLRDIRFRCSWRAD